ncbi:aspartate--tRNA(Asp/Asn) ligase [Desulfosarcina alkanivorans]|uniref:Aspartate--tRNA(Asp/Asn) ligase n=1 Tax=Desulfosarcina alkanivorans TaxID=571177 RepID=A0A5K7YN38_9BACT|nr:aspartate--tRNA ligase [Desulfosarcina alkanivorans]BBO69289.1 aspartate--tRNA(Asp/Asn) ligase [Desulfosarcina alkanivorans]
MNYHNRSYCGELGVDQVDQNVQIAGWVDALRDHGEVTFVHLRDRSGIVQLVFSPQFSPEAVCRDAAELKNEFCITATGRVVRRAEGTENLHISTGSIEVVIETLAILSRSETLPFSISEKAMVASAAGFSWEAVSEDLRLQHRYLDLRRPSMQNFLIKRHRINARVRDFLNQRGFIDVETPMLTKSTPEGARDYLVPSRVHPHQFYALPQSPQLFKQLLMISGFERYYQITRCFRDEDLRPNRQPEFTQLDLEASFIDEDFIYELIEELLAGMFEIGHIRLPRPFPKMTWQEAMDLTGSDRPDLRFEMFFVEATDIFKDTEYSIFRQVLQRGGRIRGINVKQASEPLSKNILQNEYAKEIVPGFGAKGMTWMRVTGGRLDSNIVQFFSLTEQRRVIERFDAVDGDVLLMIADPSLDTVNAALGQLRLHVANRLGRIPRDTFKPVWITEFPLFEATEEGISSSHHPFTAPDRDDFDPARIEDLLTLRSRSYDIVVNGEELGGGSIRIHDRRMQQKIFTALGLSEASARDKFGFFLNALDYGPPPHGGLALGMDRVVAMILNTASIREVTAFPKNRSAYCPLTSAPSGVSRGQLQELNLLDLGGREELPGTDHQQDPIDKLSWLSRIGLDDGERPAVAAAVEDAKRMADAVVGRAPEESPSFSALPAVSRYRDIEPAQRSPFVETGELFKNAPAVKGDFFKVASILE